MKNLWKQMMLRVLSSLDLEAQVKNKNLFFLLKSSP